MAHHTPKRVWISTDTIRLSQSASNHPRGRTGKINEIRNLAKRSSEASKDIQTLVRDIMDQVTTGKEWVGQLENGFNKIVQTIKQTSDALSEVSLATQESSRGIEQIGQAMDQMNDAVEQNASLVDELGKCYRTVQRESWRSTRYD